MLILVKTEKHCCIQLKLGNQQNKLGHREEKLRHHNIKMMQNIKLFGKKVLWPLKVRTKNSHLKT